MFINYDSSALILKSLEVLFQMGKSEQPTRIEIVLGATAVTSVRSY